MLKLQVWIKRRQICLQCFVFVCSLYVENLKGDNSEKVICRCLLMTDMRHSFIVFRFVFFVYIILRANFVIQKSYLYFFFIAFHCLNLSFHLSFFGLFILSFSIVFNFSLSLRYGRFVFRLFFWFYTLNL